jgi:hypothetical protein
VINASSGYVPLYCPDGVFVIGHCGETGFGWGVEEHHDIESRINFAYIQAMSIDPLKGNEWLEMLDRVIKENSNAKEVISKIDVNYEHEDDDEYFRGYIDHQSCASEGENTEIFDNMQMLKDFIFGTGSYIHVDNDN